MATKNPTPAAAPATAPGAGTQYTQDASATANSNGKASASVAGGDPVNSPVIGNPGENRADMGYDYGLAGAQSRGQAIQASAPLQPVHVLVQQAPPAEVDDTEYAETVRARAKGHYDGIREKGEVFENSRNLPTYPSDPNSWFEDADLDPEWEVKEKAAKRRR